MLPLPPPRGGRPGWGWARKGAANRLQHSVKIGQYLVVPEAKNVISAFLKVSGPISARAQALAVLTAIDFDDELSIETDEVDDVAADRTLAAKAMAVDLTHPQAPPQAPLGHGHIPPEIARALVRHRLFAPIPPPYPPPLSGGGFCHVSNYSLLPQGHGKARLAFSDPSPATQRGKVWVGVAASGEPFPEGRSGDTDSSLIEAPPSQPSPTKWGKELERASR